MPKSKHQIPGRVRASYEFIKAHRDRHRAWSRCVASRDVRFLHAG